jgi:ribonuclease P protein component
LTLYRARSAGAERVRTLRRHPEHRRGAASGQANRLSAFLRRGLPEGGIDDEKNISTEPPGAEAPSRFPRTHGDQERAQGAQPPPGQGAQAPVGVTVRRTIPARLKKRRDFLAAAKGHRSARRAFVLEARERGDGEPPRLGFTVTKRTAKKAVERNRIRRRLREAARQAAATDARAGLDYVLVARRAALSEPFAELTSAVAEAMRGVGTKRRDEGKARTSR